MCHENVKGAAVLSSQIGSKKARALGLAHERGNKKAFEKNILEHGVLPDSVSMEMDLWNNEVGILIGRDNKHASYDCLIYASNESYFITYYSFFFGTDLFLDPFLALYLYPNDSKL